MAVLAPWRVLAPGGSRGWNPRRFGRMLAMHSAAMPRRSARSGRAPQRSCRPPAPADIVRPSGCRSAAISATRQPWPHAWPMLRPVPLMSAYAGDHDAPAPSMLRPPGCRAHAPANARQAIATESNSGHAAACGGPRSPAPPKSACAPWTMAPRRVAPPPVDRPRRGDHGRLPAGLPDRPLMRRLCSGQMAWDMLRLASL
jgi:hypothetical protein